MSGGSSPMPRSPSASYLEEHDMSGSTSNLDVVERYTQQLKSQAEKRVRDELAAKQIANIFLLCDLQASAHALACRLQHPELWVEHARSDSDVKPGWITPEGPKSSTGAEEKELTFDVAGAKGKLPDGPFDPDGFHFKGKTVRFGKAFKPRRLLLALWDAKKKRPTRPQEIEKVIGKVWGHDSDTTDGAFRSMCSSLRTHLQKSQCPLDIKSTGALVELVPL